MHYEALYEMGYFVHKYLDPAKKMRILEVGSKDDANPKKELVFRRYFKKPNWEYIGLDIAAGRNVDVVTEDPYHYPFQDSEFDLVVCGNTLEHVPDMHAVMKEIARVTKDLVWILIPNYRPMHEYPIDCWRVYPSGMKFLLEDVAKLKIIECRRCGNAELADTLGIAKKT